MFRERALKVVLGVVGLLFLGGLYPLFAFETHPGEQMLAAVYATLGVFLLLALRNPAANRSLIAFTAWSSVAHAAIMAVQAFHHLIPHSDLFAGVLPLLGIGAVLIVLAPGRANVAMV